MCCHVLKSSKFFIDSKLASDPVLLTFFHPLSTMASNRFEPSTIRNKIKREEVARKGKKDKRQEKLQKRLARAKVEANDPLAKRYSLSSCRFIHANDTNN